MAVPTLVCITGYVGVASQRSCCRECAENASGLTDDATGAVAAL